MAILVSAGRAICSGRMIGLTAPSQVEPHFVAIGSGTQTELVTRTALAVEYVTGTWTGYARTSASGTQATVTTANDSYQIQGTFTAPRAETVSEAGDFDALTVGNMLIYGTFTGVVLATGDSIQITIRLTFV
jgi:hypothetical protein